MNDVGLAGQADPVVLEAAVAQSRGPGRWRAVNGPHLVALVRAGAAFKKGVLIENKSTEDQGAA